MNMWRRLLSGFLAVWMAVSVLPAAEAEGAAREEETTVLTAPAEEETPAEPDVPEEPETPEPEVLSRGDSMAWRDGERSEADFAYSAGNGITLYFNTSTQTITECTTSQNVDKLDIPAAISGVPVTRIGAWAFCDCMTLKHIVIPNTVNSIGKGAFSSSYIQKIDIPDSVTAIESSAFNTCTLLTEVRIPRGITRISENLFQSCTSLKSVRILYGVQSIESGVFDGCFKLETVEIPETVTEIGNGAFRNCKKITEIQIPDRVASIGSSAFEGCTALSSITLPSKLSYIDYRLFDGCSNLKSIQIPLSVTSIEYFAFLECTGLTDVYYAGSEEQWSQLVTNGSVSKSYITAYGAVIHFNHATGSFIPSTPAADEQVSIDADSYYTSTVQRLFRVRGAGSPYPGDVGFTVNVGGQAYASERTTGASTDDVTATVPADYTGNITFTRDGYYDNFVPAQYTGALNYVTMTPRRVTGIFANTLLASAGTEKYPKYVNLVTGLQGSELSVYELGLGKPAKEREYYVSINWNNHGAGEVWLEQGDQRIALVDGTSVSCAVETEFKAGKQVDLCARAKDGTALRVKTSITIRELGNDGVSLGFGNKASAPIKEEGNKALDIINGQTFELDFSSLSNDLIPCKFEISKDGSVKGTIGLETPDGKYSEAAFGKINEAVKQLRDKNSTDYNYLTAGNISEIEKLYGTRVTDRYSKVGTSVKVQVLGCFTGKLEKGELQITDLSAMIVGKGSMSYEHDTYISILSVPVPTYLKVTLATKVQLAYKFEYDEYMKFYMPAGEDHATLSASLSLSPEIGVGREAIASLGIKGTGTIGMNTPLPITPSEMEMTIMAGLYIVGSVFGISGEWELSVTPEMVMWENGGPAWHKKADTAQLYGMEFVPDLEQSVMVFAAASDSSTMAENISGYAPPALAELSDGWLLAVWTADVPGRSGVDKNGLYYSVLDGSTWSQAALVENDGTNDSLPALWQAGGEVWLTWQNYTKTYDTNSLDGLDYDQLAAQMEMKAVKFDAAKGSFDTANAETWAIKGTGPAWYAAGQTQMPSTWEGEAPASTSNLQTFSGADYQAILYTAAEEGGPSNVYGLFNDGWGWGEPLRLTDFTDHDDAGGFSAVISQEGTLRLLVNEIRRKADGSYDHADLGFYERDLFGEGAGVDLAVSNVDYVHETLTPNGTLTVTAEVANNSARTVSGLTANVAGMSSDHQITLLPGQTKTVYINYSLGGTLPSSLPVKVTPRDQTDANPENNSGSCTLISTDLSLEELTAERTDSGAVLTAMVVNRGSEAAVGYTVTYHKDTPDGEIITESAGSAALASGETEYLSVSAGSLEPGTMVYAEVAMNSGARGVPEENLIANNLNQAVVVSRQGDETAAAASIKSSGSGSTVVQLSGLYLSLPAGAQVLAASYDTNGRLTASAAGSLQADNTVRFSRRLEPGWTLFLTDGQSRPLSGKITLE